MLNINDALLFRDLGTLTLPSKKLIAQSLVNFFELPLWNPFALGGAPFLADPSFATYYPLNLIFCFFTEAQSARAMSWFIIIHLPLILMGLYKALQKISHSKILSIILAITIGGSGFTMSASYLTGSLAGLLSLGWTIYFLLKFFETNRFTALFFASFFLALPVLGGDPQYTFIISLTVIPFLFFQHKDRLVKKAYAILTLAILTFLVCSPQLIPTIDLLISSNRAQFSADMSNIDHWSLHPVRLLELFYSLPLDISNYRDGHQRAFVNGPDPIPFILSIYPGLLFIPLLLLAFFQKKKWSFFEISSITIGSLFLLSSMGSFFLFSLNSFFAKILPLWGSFRYPERLIIFFYLFFCLFIAKRFQSYNWNNIFDKYYTKILIKFSLILFAAILLKIFSQYRISTISIFSISFIALCCVGYYLKFIRKILPYFLVLMFCIDLCLSMKNILFTVPSKVASAEWIPFLQLLKEKNYKHSLEYSDRFLVLNESDLNWETLDKIGSKLNNDIEKLSLHQFLKLAMNTGSLFNVSSPLGYVTLMDSVHKFIWDQFPEKEIQKFLSIKGTKFIGEETATGDFIISTNPQALPISRAPNIIELKPKNMILPRMKEQKWDWNQSLIIENDTQGEIQQINDITIQVLNRSFRTFDLKLSSKSGVNFPVWVHWNETFSRYLQFEQEGKPLESRKANFWSTAFRIQPIHKESYIIVTAKYQNPLIPLGQSLFYVWVGLGIILYRFDRRKRTSKVRFQGL